MPVLTADCMVIGDSIAEGVSWSRPECAHITKVGINSKHWNIQHIGDPRVSRDQWDTVVISLGTNDPSSKMTIAEIGQLRAALHSKRVFWILPSEHLRPLQRGAVIDTAAAYGDPTISIPLDIIGPDHIHPIGAGYRLIAAESR